MTEQRKQFTTRIVETLVMSLVTGAIISAAGLLFALPVVQEQVKAIRFDVIELKGTLGRFSDRMDKIDDRVRMVEINRAQVKP